MNDDDTRRRFDGACGALGVALAEAFPESAAGIAGSIPARLEAVWVGRSSTAGRRARRARRSFGALAMVSAIAAGVLLFGRGRVLHYQLEGAVAVGDGRFQAPPAAEADATLRFSDGTTISVAHGGAGRVKACTRTGATIELERGRASFSVVHRPRTDWHVEVGPFDVAVTGTVFDVETTEPRDGFEIAMKVGTVVVRGPLMGAGVTLRAGQRLVASLSRGTRVIGELTGVPAPAPARTIAAPAMAQPMATGPERGKPRPAAARAKRSLALVAPQAHVGVPPSPATAPPPPPAAPPPAAPPPAAPRSTLLDAGGAACASGVTSQLTFDLPGPAVSTGGGRAAALSSPLADRTRSWCGAGSLRFRAEFNTRETLNARLEGARPFRAGEAVIRLPTLVDLRGKTVMLHLFVDGPPEATFEVRIFGEAVGVRVGHDVTPNLHPGRWLTIRSHYPPPAAFDPAQSTPTGMESLVVRLDATGPLRTWTGAVYVDDISWH